MKKLNDKHLEYGIQNSAGRWFGFQYALRRSTKIARTGHGWHTHPHALTLREATAYAKRWGGSVVRLDQHPSYSMDPKIRAKQALETAS